MASIWENDLNPVAAVKPFLERERKAGFCIEAMRFEIGSLRISG